ncbi:MAG: phosphoribosylamine--glycine ligase [Bryobacterales bacterium]|nr:phosphoribosylamine--glycine ligase [Bryobacteraceae bacterium]MDW8353010.1 phosphoribosylamine--glycine ligase [Bryobacterales bacterium]
MKVLVIGSGGREHALAWKLAQSPLFDELIVAPGNAGMARCARLLTPTRFDPEGLLALAEEAGADLTVVGPEAPLVEGIADLFRSRGKLIVGPSRAAARLEGSKVFAKDCMRRWGVPTAEFRIACSFDDVRQALDFFGCPVVLKADGLAAGKGVVLADDRQEAERVAAAMLSGEFVGEAGRRLVIERRLQGEEVSFIVLTDGTRVLPLAPTQDHKAVYDGDRGPNTGGMGAYCDSRILTETETQQILDRIVYPVLEGMRAEGITFTGFLYAGLMITAEGPMVLEFNVRMGDPEAQPLVHRLESDLGEVLLELARGELRTQSLRWRPEPSVCVVLAAAGYPGTPRKGDLIAGVEEAEAAGAVVFHAGTRLGPRGLETASGRVLGVTASGVTLPEAIQRVYAAVSKIHFEGMHYRRDIGAKGLKRWAATVSEAPA